MLRPDDIPADRRRLMESLRDLCGAACEDGLSVPMLAVLTTVMLNEGIAMPELGDIHGMTSGATSRYVSALGIWGRRTCPGLHYVNTADNPANRRQKCVFTTPKGRRVINALIDFLDEGGAADG